MEEESAKKQDNEISHRNLSNVIVFLSMLADEHPETSHLGELNNSGQ